MGMSAESETELLGDISGGGTPGPFPNPAVKAASADGTWRAASWERRSLPSFVSLFHPSGSFVWAFPCRFLFLFPFVPVAKAKRLIINLKPVPETAQF
jgi:hypothetical protein